MRKEKNSHLLRVIRLPKKIRHTEVELQFMSIAGQIEKSPPTTASSILLWSIVLFFGTVLVWMFVGKVEVVATARGKFVPEGNLKVVQASENSIVKGIYITVGESVKKEQILFELDPTISQTEHGVILDNLNNAKLDLIRLTSELSGRRPDFSKLQVKTEFIALQESMYVAQEAMHRAKITEALNIKKSNDLVLAGAETDLIKLEMLAKAAHEKEERVRPHIGIVMSRFDYMQLQDDLTKNTTNVTAQRKHVMALREQSRSASERLKQIEQEHSTTLLNEIAETKTRIAKFTVDMTRVAQQLDLKQLRAPVSGKIQSIEIATVGGIIAPAQVLATIVPDESPLLIEATLSSNDIGFVAEGQDATIKIDSYPFTTYGTLPGTVTIVSPDSVSSAQSLGANTSPQDRVNTPVYKIYIKPNAWTLNGKHRKLPVSVGMSAQIDIKTDQRRIIDLILSPITKNFREGVALR